MRPLHLENTPRPSIRCTPDRPDAPNLRLGRVFGSRWLRGLGVRSWRGFRDAEPARIGGRSWRGFRGAKPARIGGRLPETCPNWRPFARNLRGSPHECTKPFWLGWSSAVRPPCGSSGRFRAPARVFPHFHGLLNRDDSDVLHEAPLACHRKRTKPASLVR